MSSRGPLYVGVRRVATVRSDDEAFATHFTKEYERVAGIANAVLAGPQGADAAAGGEGLQRGG